VNGKPIFSGEPYESSCVHPGRRIAEREGYFSTRTLSVFQCSAAVSHDWPKDSVGHWILLKATIVAVAPLRLSLHVALQLYTPVVELPATWTAK
jgi:hypothetical protein